MSSILFPKIFAATSFPSNEGTVSSSFGGLTTLGGLVMSSSVAPLLNLSFLSLSCCIVYFLYSVQAIPVRAFSKSSGLTSSSLFLRLFSSLSLFNPIKSNSS